jgi:hypothetical protein
MEEWQESVFLSVNVRDHAGRALAASSQSMVFSIVARVGDSMDGGRGI